MCPSTHADQNCNVHKHITIQKYNVPKHISIEFKKQVETLLLNVDKLVKSKRYDDATEEILVLEKKCRQASDAISCSKLVCKVVTM